MLVVNCSRVSKASRWSSCAMEAVVSGDMKRRATAYRVPTHVPRAAKKLQDTLPTLKVCGAA